MHFSHSISSSSSSPSLSSSTLLTSTTLTNNINNNYINNNNHNNNTNNNNRTRILSIIETLKRNILFIYVVIFLIFVPNFVNSVPLLENLPSEAKKEMEGLIHYLPSSLQGVMSSNDGFSPAFLQSLLLILACELGDRTFFVAAILAMKSSRLTVWCGSLLALALMTVLSAAIGKAFPLILDKKYTSIAAALLFLYFGLQLLKDYWKMRNDDSENEELVEVEEELKNSSSSSNHSNNDNKKELSTSNPLYKSKSILLLTSCIPPIFTKAFTMTALAEWGDRSQIATIALAASRDLTGVILGGILGHSICTGLAVIGGRILASRISEKAVALMGGILFVAFAFLTAGGVMQ